MGVTTDAPMGSMKDMTCLLELKLPQEALFGEYKRLLQDSSGLPPLPPQAELLPTSLSTLRILPDHEMEEFVDVPKSIDPQLRRLMQNEQFGVLSKILAPSRRPAICVC